MLGIGVLMLGFVVILLDSVVVGSDISPVSARLTALRSGYFPLPH